MARKLAGAAPMLREAEEAADALQKKRQVERMAGADWLPAQRREAEGEWMARARKGKAWILMEKLRCRRFRAGLRLKRPAELRAWLPHRPAGRWNPQGRGP